MKTLLKQKGTKHDTREEVHDALAAMQTGHGCVFAYADFTEMRAVGFFEMNPAHLVVPSPQSLIDNVTRPTKWRGQDWVVVNDDTPPGPDEEDRIKVKIDQRSSEDCETVRQEEEFFNYLTNRH